VAKSTEITTAVILVSMFAGLKMLGPFVVERIILIFHDAFTQMNYDEIGIQLATQIYIHFLIQGMFILAPILAIAFFSALISEVAQVGWKPTGKPLQPKLNRLSPIQGLKRMFSFKTIIELIKSILKLGIISVIVYFTLRDYENLIYLFYDVSIFESYKAITDIVFDLGIRIGMYFIIIAAIDYTYQRVKLSKDLKMTKQEVKEERKMMDGNPEIKSRIRQKMREAAMRRMMQDLPKADVIITNPTHFAIAIQYDDTSSAAPKVIAKGADLLAARIREKAKEYDIELIENKGLARTLYYTVEIGEEIPPELYQAVAEVLAFVYSMKHRSVTT
jgi:flagellar biosynthesis protein FlhB